MHKHKNNKINLKKNLMFLHSVQIYSSKKNKNHINVKESIKTNLKNLPSNYII